MTFVALQSYSSVLKWGNHWRTAGLKSVCSESLQKAKFLWPVQGKCLAWTLPVGWVPRGLLFTTSVQVVPRVHCLCWWRGEHWNGAVQNWNTAWRGWWREADVPSKAKWDILVPQGMQYSLSWCNSSLLSKEENTPTHIPPWHVPPSSPSLTFIWLCVKLICVANAGESSFCARLIFYH